jgi:hypothetical protein
MFAGSTPITRIKAEVQDEGLEGIRKGGHIEMFRFRPPDHHLAIKL